MSHLVFHIVFAIYGLRVCPDELSNTEKKTINSSNAKAMFQFMRFLLEKAQ